MHKYYAGINVFTYNEFNLMSNFIIALTIIINIVTTIIVTIIINAFNVSVF